MKKITLIAILAGVLFVACGENAKVKIDYDHPDRYSVGDATITQPVNKLSIDWVVGGVDIRYSADSCFRIREESDSTLGDSLRMRYYIDEDGELEIKYCQNGTYSHGRLTAINKRLVVEVPRDASLDEVDIDMVDGLISYDSVRCRELSLDVVNVATTVWTPTLPDEISLDAVRATLRLYVPSTAGMTIEMDGIKTELSSELPVAKKDKKTTVIGDGRCRVDIDAVSTEMYINELKAQ